MTPEEHAHVQELEARVKRYRARIVELKAAVNATAETLVSVERAFRKQEALSQRRGDRIEEQEAEIAHLQREVDRRGVAETQRQAESADSEQAAGTSDVAQGHPTVSTSRSSCFFAQKPDIGCPNHRTPMPCEWCKLIGDALAKYCDSVYLAEGNEQ